MTINSPGYPDPLGRNLRLDRWPDFTYDAKTALLATVEREARMEQAAEYDRKMVSQCFGTTDANEEDDEEYEPTPDDLAYIATRSSTPTDQVNHPDHYTWLKDGVEVIDITSQFSFTLGNALKYIMRAGHKGEALEDLKKARWYLDYEITKIEGEDDER